MTKQKLNISILTDKDSWFNAYQQKFVHYMGNVRDHNVIIVDDIEKIPVGDICFLLSVYEVIRPEILSRNKNNIVIHESKLPQGRGWSPLSWQILEGKNEIDVSLIEAAEKVDSGDVYLTEKIYLSGHELIDEIRERQSNVRLDLCLQFIKNYPENLKDAKKQDLTLSTFYKKRSTTDSELKINDTIENQFNLLRIVDNKKYPAFFTRKGMRYKLTIEKIDPHQPHDIYSQMIDIKEGD